MFLFKSTFVFIFLSKNKPSLPTRMQLKLISEYVCMCVCAYVCVLECETDPRIHFHWGLPVGNSLSQRCTGMSSNFLRYRLQDYSSFQLRIAPTHWAQMTGRIFRPEPYLYLYSCPDKLKIWICILVLRDFAKPLSVAAMLFFLEIKSACESRV